MYCVFGGGPCENATINSCSKYFENLIQCRDYYSKLNEQNFKDSEAIGTDTAICPDCKTVLLYQAEKDSYKCQDCSKKYFHEHGELKEWVAE
jgi:uncharacterized CHY-type Zn-finger protein